MNFIDLRDIYEKYAFSISISFHFEHFWSAQYNNAYGIPDIQ